MDAFLGGTYNGEPFPESGAKASDLSDRQIKFLTEDNQRHILITSVETPAVAAQWNNNMQALVEGIGLGIPGNSSSDPRHGSTPDAEYNAGAEYAGSGNMGVLDITAGLKWVNENITGFGGDPNNVMIFGESGGGAKTSCIYAMPEASPYFNKASIESGPGVRMLTKELAAETTEKLLKELDIAKKDWRKLLDIPADELLKLQDKFMFIPPFIEKVNMPGMNGFGPVVDGIVLPNHPFDPTTSGISKDKPLLTGWNEDEYTFFAMQMRDADSFKIGFDELPAKLKPQFGNDTKTIIEVYRTAMPKASAPDIYVAVNSIAMMCLGFIEIAEKKAQEKGAPVYLFNFGYKMGMKIPGTDYPMGTPHALDIAYKFNNVQPLKEGEQLPMMGFGDNSPESCLTSHKFAKLWTTFARTGVPAVEGGRNGLHIILTIVRRCESTRNAR